jgi:hypothetical protein
MTLQDVGILFAVVASILGWVYQLGHSSARLGRNEKDIEALKARQEQSEKDLRIDIRDNFNKVFQKLDDLPCHNPKWDRSEC